MSAKPTKKTAKKAAVKRRKADAVPVAPAAKPKKKARSLRGVPVAPRSRGKAAKKKAPVRPSGPVAPRSHAGRPSKFTAAILGRICAGLEAGTPLAMICRGEGMPDPATVWRWRQEDEEISQAIARAREIGFDEIAHATLKIADDRSQDLLASEFGDKPNTAAVMRAKLMIDTRMNLLAKWDPKRYGTKVATEISGPGGGAVKVAAVAELSEDQERRIIAAAQLGAALIPPACLDPARADEESGEDE